MPETTDTPHKPAREGQAEEFYQKALSFNEPDTYRIRGSQAVPWLLKAARLGHLEAQHALGVRYFHDHSFLDDIEPDENFESAVINVLRYDPNLATAVYWFNHAAGGGHALSMFYLSECLRGGLGTPQNVPLGIQYLRSAAERGQPTAQLRLGEAYRDGRDVEKDPAAALYWFEKAAEREDAIGAFLSLASCHHNGIGTEKNDSLAFYWWNKAAEKGDKRAMNHLGLAYSRGEGVPEDKRQAFRWFRRAVEVCYADPDALYNVGLAYLNGDGVARNYVEAFRFIAKAAEDRCPMALYTLGELYFYGLGTEPDLKNAGRTMGMALASGNPEAAAAVLAFEEREGLSGGAEKSEPPRA